MTTPSNKLYFGETSISCGSRGFDLCLDPPFNSNATYNVLFRERSGEESAAQITAFEDTWRWTIESETPTKRWLRRGRESWGIFCNPCADSSVRTT